MGPPERFARPLPVPIGPAMRSPLPAFAGAGGGALVLVLGGGIAGAAITAVVIWAVAVVVVALARGARAGAGGGPRIDPFTVGEPWRRFVKDAVQARNRFDEAVRRTPEGPLQERLADVGTRVSTGVEEVWRIARHGHALAGARRDLGPGQIRRRLAALEQSGASTDADPGHRAAVEGLRAQLASVDRLEATIADAEQRLRVLDARLAEAVARSLELSVQSAGEAALRALGDDVDGVVGDLEALRQALEETGSGPPGGGPSGPGGLPPGS